MERTDDGKTMEIAKALRCCTDVDSCENCPLYDGNDYSLECFGELHKASLATIESLTTQLAEAKAERDAALSRLKEFDDAEREGRLVRLPCAIGDTVYEIRRATAKESADMGIKPDRIGHRTFILYPNRPFIIREKKMTKSDYAKFGKTVFLTRAEAEKGEGE